ncbi:hypothetical protein TrVFT333_006998 [Trichoderma virens FT-333]|nr:hypothetical protein TrVFT333_006998 [Trichoderma virens FT-333]
MSAIVSVSNLVQQCLDKFNDAITAKNDMDYQDHLKARLANFSSWMDNVVAMAKLGVSLENSFRLHCLDVLRHYLDLLLNALDEHMETVHQGVPISQTLFSIDSLIKSLEGIETSIRNASKASRSHRANKSFNPDEHHDFKWHLECLFEDQSAENYFEDEESAGSSKRQNDHTQPLIVQSDLSNKDLDNQDILADSIQFAIELHAAVTRGDGNAVRNLLKDYHVLDDGDETKRALIAAVQGGHIAVIQQLLKSGIDINSQDDYGRTILFYAIQRKDKSMAEYFVRLGIDVNIKDHASLTALQMAIQKGDNEIISTIFTPAVYQKSRDDKGDKVQEVISWAKEQRHPSAAKVLSVLRTRYESMLSRAQKTFNIEDRTTAAQSIINGNDWFALIDPLLEPVYLDLMGVLPHKDRVLRVAFSPDGKYIVTGSWDGSVNIFNVETKQTVFQIVLSQGLPAFDVCFSPDGRSIATTSDKLIQVWDIKKKKIQRSFEHDRVCDALDFSNDGRFLASSDRGSTVHIWGLEKGVSSRKFTVSNDAITRIQISPDSCHVVAGTYFGSVSIWNLKTNTLERKLQHGHNVKSIVFSSDGKHIATGGTPLFKVWELDTGDCLSDFGVPGSRAVSVSITPDDRWTIIAPEDRSIQFWDRTTGRSHRIIDAHAAITRSVAFRPQGGYFATASDDKTVRIWSYGPHRTP